VTATRRSVNSGISKRFSDPIFLLGEEVEQQGAEASISDDLRDEVVAGTLSTGSTPVSEDDHARRIRRDFEHPFQFDVVDRNGYEGL